MIQIHQWNVRSPERMEHPKALELYEELWTEEALKLCRHRETFSRKESSTELFDGRWKENTHGPIHDAIVRELGELTERELESLIVWCEHKI